MYWCVFVKLHNNQKTPQNSNLYPMQLICNYNFSLNIIDAEQIILSLYDDNIPIHSYRYLQTLWHEMNNDHIAWSNISQGTFFNGKCPGAYLL